MVIIGRQSYMVLLIFCTFCKQQHRLSFVSVCFQEYLCRDSLGKLSYLLNSVAKGRSVQAHCLWFPVLSLGVLPSNATQRRPLAHPVGTGAWATTTEMLILGLPAVLWVTKCFWSLTQESSNRSYETLASEQASSPVG